MYAVTSIPFTRRTLATLQRAEFGFFGVSRVTRVHTPASAGLTPERGSCSCIPPFATVANQLVDSTAYLPWLKNECNSFKINGKRHKKTCLPQSERKGTLFFGQFSKRKREFLERRNPLHASRNDVNTCYPALL
jgi:hypothetical protein